MSRTASKTPEYSIECGVQELKAALVSAEVENPIDMERIKQRSYPVGSGSIYGYGCPAY